MGCGAVAARWNARVNGANRMPTQNVLKSGFPFDEPAC